MQAIQTATNNGVRFEYTDAMHGLSALPIIQQITGPLTVLVSLARLVVHAVQHVFTSSAGRREEIKQNIRADREGIFLGLARTIPFVGSLISLILLFRVDSSHGFTFFPHLESQRTFSIVRT